MRQKNANGHTYSSFSTILFWHQLHGFTDSTITFFLYLFLWVYSCYFLHQGHSLTSTSCLSGITRSVEDGIKRHWLMAEQQEIAFMIPAAVLIDQSCGPLQNAKINPLTKGQWLLIACRQQSLRFPSLSLSLNSSTNRCLVSLRKQLWICKRYIHCAAPVNKSHLNYCQSNDVRDFKFTRVFCWTYFGWFILLLCATTPHSLAYKFFPGEFIPVQN